METVAYPYRPKVGRMALLMIAMLGVATWLGYMAWTNDSGLLINGRIPLSPPAATALFAGFTAVLILLAGLGLRGVVLGLRGSQVIEAGAFAVSLPRRMLSREIITIPYHEIEALTLKKAGLNLSLVLKHLNGTTLIDRDMLPNEAAFAHVVETIQSRKDRGPDARVRHSNRAVHA